MKIKTSLLHTNCPYYFAENHIGFSVISISKDNHYTGTRHEHNTLFFLLEGQMEFSYNGYIRRVFAKGDLIFIPQASHLYIMALMDAEMLVLTYDLADESCYSNCTLSRAKLDVRGIETIRYDFQPLKMVPEIVQLARLIKSYIECDYRCLYLHELKQKELFIIMEYAYTHRQKMEFFYPILGENISFRSKVLCLAHEQLTVEEYARRLNMGDRTFSRKFKSEFGQTTQEWLLQHKIAQIKFRISLPGVDVSSIVQEFNFVETSHLYRFCRTHFGCTFKELIEELQSKKALSAIELSDIDTELSN